MFALEIVMLRRELSFVKVTVFEILLEPGADVPKLMAVGLTLTLAFATLARVKRMVAAAAIVLPLILLLDKRFIRFPCFAKRSVSYHRACAKIGL